MIRREKNNHIFKLYNCSWTFLNLFLTRLCLFERGHKPKRLTQRVKVGFEGDKGFILVASVLDSAVSVPSTRSNC